MASFNEAIGSATDRFGRSRRSSVLTQRGDRRCDEKDTCNCGERWKRRQYDWKVGFWYYVPCPACGKGLEKREEGILFGWWCDGKEEV